jgi:uncharacterized membrane protein YcaP (DUF421 family)
VSQIEYVWHDIFTIQISVGDKILRSVLIYVFLIAMLRIVGKRELGQANTLDLVVLLLVANAVQTGAVIGAATLFVINELFSRATYLSPFASRLLEGEPTQLIEDGQLVKRALRSTGISLSELRAIARRQGFAHLGDVHTAILETNGVVTMFKENEPLVYHPAEPGGLRIGKRWRSRG